MSQACLPGQAFGAWSRHRLAVLLAQTEVSAGSSEAQ